MYKYSVYCQKVDSGKTWNDSESIYLESFLNATRAMDFAYHRAMNHGDWWSEDWYDPANPKESTGCVYRVISLKDSVFEKVFVKEERLNEFVEPHDAAVKLA